MTQNGLKNILNMFWKVKQRLVLTIPPPQMQKKVTITDILALYAEIFLNVKEKVQTWKGNKVSKLLEWIACCSLDVLAL